MFDISEAYDMDGESYGVYPDNAYGEPPMQPRTATGNGYGYDTGHTWLNALGGTLQSALDYALIRDQQKIAQQTGYTSVQAPMIPTPQVQASMQNSRMLILGLIGVAAIFALRGGK